MSAPPSILNKVKLLLNLAASPNPNEASNAREMADKLISKYNITEEELASLEPKEFYGENEKLFVTLGIVGWRQQLALAVSKYFDCQIVQEELVPAEGIHQYNYYVYGDDDQVKEVQFVYHAFCKKVENLVETRCLGRGPVYVDSYCEGVVESIKLNIAMYGIDVPEIKRTLKKEEEATPPNSKTITKSTTNKEEPTDKRVDINANSFIKDIMAYFKGLEDGKELSLQDILELEKENKESEQLN
jgi:hypothetical protein